MRISDWSSDVCSSDLGVGLLEGFLVDDHRRRGLRRLVGHGGVAVVSLLEQLVVLGGRAEVLVGVAQRLGPLGRAEKAVGGLAELLHHLGAFRPEERRVGKEWVSTCRSRWYTLHLKTKPQRLLQM